MFDSRRGGGDDLRRPALPTTGWAAMKVRRPARSRMADPRRSVSPCEYGSRFIHFWTDSRRTRQSPGPLYRERSGASRVRPRIGRARNRIERDGRKCAGEHWRRSRDSRAPRATVDPVSGPSRVLLILRQPLRQLNLVEPAKFRLFNRSPAGSLSPRNSRADDHQPQQTIARISRRAHVALRWARPSLAGRPGRRRGDAEPGRRLWIDRLSEGLADTGELLSAADGERIVRLVAAMSAPRFIPAARASQPSCRKRRAVRSLLPPGRDRAVFAIRKPAVAVFTLDDYVAAGIMSAGPGRHPRAGRRRPAQHPRRGRHSQPARPR